MLSVPQVINNKLKNVLKNEDKISNTIKTIDSSIKGIKKPLEAWIIPTGHKIKYIMKVIKSLENKGVSLKGTIRKITSQKRGFLNSLRPLLKLDYH